MRPKYEQFGIVDRMVAMERIHNKGHRAFGSWIELPFKEGEAFEVNNTIPHRVDQTGLCDRVTMVIDLGDRPCDEYAVLSPKRTAFEMLISGMYSTSPEGTALSGMYSTFPEYNMKRAPHSTLPPDCAAPSGIYRTFRNLHHVS